ncbi:hypothetical protein AWZ03_013021 [Drosophila navojoa]|uniref:Uncharacterized protein n=2 Tax=Drosophila navojoa TaxID=7232 RepID=A0A484AY81_DRONA|nr:hypothetical protein AWZ03_013021 [Drosophila navojoa]
MPQEEKQSLSPSTTTSWTDSEDSRTASTASLVQQQLKSTPLRSGSRVGPGLLLFPGTAQRADQRRAAKERQLEKPAAQASEGHDASLNRRKPYSIRSFRRPPLWQPPAIKAEAEATLKEEQQEQQVAPLPYLAKLQAFIIEFLQGSSIHGFIYLAKFGLNFLERMLWFAFICVALFSIISLSQRTWQRFQTSPMVISMDRNKLVWNTSFPSLTVCPHKRIDDIKLEDYIEAHSEKFVDEDDKEFFRDFIIKLASLTYDNLETLPLNKSYGIDSSDYLSLLYELKWPFEPEISSGAAVKMFIYETQTEFGICHSVNSLVARYNTYK